MSHATPDPAAERSPNRRTFSYEEALESFPAVRDLTRAAQRRIEALVNRIPSHDQLEARRDELEGEVAKIVEAWAIEVAALGCEVKGLWLVDWDSGDGYYCWKYPETSVAHFHGYDDGFDGRMPIC
jgi:hypothetical protein